MAKSGVFLLSIVLCFTPVRRAFIIESFVGTAVFGSLAYVAPKVWCRFKECCTDRWISANITGLQSALRRGVFGQHFQHQHQHHQHQHQQHQQHQQQQHQQHQHQQHQRSARRSFAPSGNSSEATVLMCEHAEALSGTRALIPLILKAPAYYCM